MNAKQYILKRIAERKPSAPATAVADRMQCPSEQGSEQAFRLMAERMGSRVTGYQEAVAWLQERAAAGGGIRSFAREFAYHSDEPYAAVVIAPAAFGVAENACMWVSDGEVEDMLQLFTCEHLVLVLERRQIVADMHQAYGRVRNSTFGYGLFIAGPSKTADIEQVLVTGAHGPEQCTIVLT